LPRWESASRVKSYFSQEVKDSIASYDPIAEFDGMLPDKFMSWEPLARAQYIEAKTFLQGYLISSQGDRMLSANSVEGRFPFMDHRLVEFAFNLPASFKLKVLEEKHLLKSLSREYLPAEITGRVRQPYRSSDSECFLGAQSPAYVDDLLTPRNLKESGYFDPVAVASLVKKCRGLEPSSVSARDNLAVVSIMTTLLLDKMYIRDFN
jgi:asparagine synthase (glutamine-hydrolysing)